MTAPTTREIDCTAPAALNTDRIATDFQTGLQYWNLARNNVMLDLRNLADPAAGLLYFIKTQRDGKETRRWYSNQLLTTFTGAVRPGFPVDLAAGQLQWVEQQTLGALTAQSYLVSLLTDLSG